MGKHLHRTLKVLGILLLSVVVLLVLLAAAAQVALNTKVLDRIVRRFAAEYVDGEIRYDRLKLSLVKDFPNGRLRVENFSLVYPHERFDAYAVKNAEGRGVPMDTLAAFELLDAGVDCRLFLKEKKIHLRETHLHGLRAFIHVYDSTATNLQVIRLPEAGEKEVGAMLPPLKVDTLCVERPHVIYEDSRSELYARLDFEDMDLSGALWPVAEDYALEAALTLESLDLETLAAIVAPVRTDARLTLALAAQGRLNPAQGILPDMDVALSVPGAKLSYADLIDNGDIALEASGTYRAGKVDVTVPRVRLDVPGLALQAKGSAGDVLGGDPLIAVDGTLKAEAEKLMRYLPESASFLQARGNLDAAVEGSFRPSQLSLYRFSGTDLRARVTSDGLDIEDRRDAISAFLGKTEVRLAAMKSLVGTDPRALTLQLRTDTLGAAIGPEMFVRGKGVQILAQDSFRAIDTTRLAPLVAQLTAERLALRGADSLLVGALQTAGSLSVTPVENGGRQVPRVSLSSSFGRLLLRTEETRANLDSVRLSARATHAPRAPRERRARPDSVRFSLPDFLSEQDFRTADISFRIDESVARMVETWNPTGTLSVAEGRVITPLFPLHNSISALEAEFSPERFSLGHVRLASGTTDLEATGALDGLQAVLRGGRGIMSLRLDARADRVNVNELISAYQFGSTAVSDEAQGMSDEAYAEEVETDMLEDMPPDLTYSLLVLPANLQAEVTLNAGEVNYSNIDVRDFRTKAALRERTLQILDTKAVADFASASLEGFYYTRTKKDIGAGFNLKLADVTADRVIELVPSLNEVVPMLTHFKGDLDCEMAATAQLDTNMNFIVPSITGMFRIGGRDLILEDLGNLRRVARLLLFRNTQEGHVDQMSVSGIIGQNRLRVFPFILDIDRYTFALKGEQIFENKFDYHASVLSSPLPFRLGVNIFGKDFRDWRFRLGRAQYRNRNLPVFDTSLDEMQLNLASSIRDIFAKGVDRAMRETAFRREQLDASDDGGEELGFEEQMDLEAQIIALETDIQTAELEAEIDALFN